MAVGLRLEPRGLAPGTGLELRPSSRAEALEGLPAHSAPAAVSGRGRSGVPLPRSFRAADTPPPDSATIVRVEEDHEVPTPITHGLVGAALAQAAPGGVRRGWTVVALTGIAMLPDLDLLSFGLGIPYASPLGHRGVSHSLVFAAVIAGLVTPLLLRRGQRSPRDVLGVFLLAFAAVASHGVLDAATTGGEGVGFLLPFSEERFFWSHRPIVVSPIGLSSFQARAVMVLASEVRWVWLPLFVVTAAIQGARLLRRSGGGRWKRRSTDRPGTTEPSRSRVVPCARTGTPPESGRRRGGEGW